MVEEIGRKKKKKSILRACGCSGVDNRCCSFWCKGRRTRLLLISYMFGRLIRVNVDICMVLRQILVPK